MHEQGLDHVEPVRRHLEQDGVFGHERAHQHEQAALHVHHRGQRALAGAARLEIVADDVVEELDPLGPGDGEDPAAGDVHDRGALARRRVLFRHPLEGSSVASRLARSSACSSSMARMPSIMRRVVGSFSPK